MLLFFTIFMMTLLNISHTTTPIKGRNELFIYRVKLPSYWVEVEEEGNLKDSTKAIKKYKIENITIAIHNFKVDPSLPKIKPVDQINRWLKQFNSDEKIHHNLKERSRNGYVGYLLEATQNDKGLIALAMELDKEHLYNLLSKQSDKTDEMASDFTIKATGPKNEMIKHKQEILEFMNSFELIEELDP